MFFFLSLSLCNSQTHVHAKKKQFACMWQSQVHFQGSWGHHELDEKKKSRTHCYYYVRRNRTINECAHLHRLSFCLSLSLSWLIMRLFLVFYLFLTSSSTSPSLYYLQLCFITFFFTFCLLIYALLLWLLHARDELTKVY